MLGRVRDAVSDAAETLRRAFSSPFVVAAPPERFEVRGHGGGLMAGPEARSGLEPPLAVRRDMPRLKEGACCRTLAAFQARLMAESGWARWGAEATVLRMSALESGRAARLSVPPLPRRAATAGRVEALSRPEARRAAEPLARPGVRRLDPVLMAGQARAGLGAMLSLPVPVRGADIQRLPKGLWMRYSLQLVRETGENVRNLEVLGLFRIPRRGVADLRHDSRNGRILLHLEAAAASAPRAPFILARRKDDGGLVSCFVEDK